MQQPIRMVVARHVRSLDTSGPGHRPRPIPFFVRRHRAYAPMVLPCMRADAVLMLLPTISSSSLDSARSDSTASAHFARSVSTANSQQPTAQRPVGSGRESTLHWLLVTDCWLLGHFGRRPPSACRLRCVAATRSIPSPPGRSQPSARRAFPPLPLASPASFLISAMPFRDISST